MSLPKYFAITCIIHCLSLCVSQCVYSPFNTFVHPKSRVIENFLHGHPGTILSSSSSTSGGAVRRCCGLHENTPCNSFTCHLCCTFHSLSRHFLDIISPRYWWTTSTPFSFDCSLQYLLLNTFRSPNNVPKIV